MPSSVGPRSVPDENRSTSSPTAPVVSAWHLLRREAGHAASAIVVPAWGANVVAGAVHHAELLWPTPLLESVDLATVALKPTSYGIPLLAPTPGGVGPNQSGVFQYKGQSYRIAARHGFLRQRAWNVAESSPDALSCQLDVDPSSAGPGGFPFALKVRYDVQLLPNGLRLRIRFENVGDQTQPVDIGWHPYIYRGGACRVQIPAAERWELDREDEPTPTGTILTLGVSDDFRAARTIPVGEHWDETFTTLPESPALSCWTEESAPVLTKSGGTAMARVRRAVTFRTRAGESGLLPLRHLQLYTPPSRGAICIEPLSAPPDAINLVARRHPRATVGELAPGAHAVYEMTLTADVTLS
jgi:galactose mutarotase-like enzyme